MEQQRKCYLFNVTNFHFSCRGETIYMLFLGLEVLLLRTSIHHESSFRRIIVSKRLTTSLSCFVPCRADSWRARVSHICELQFNLSTGAMTIDFGGMDRYDYDERVKNMEEAERGII